MGRVEFTEAVKMGREIEFTCNGKAYFESREADDKWYIYSESEQIKQYFRSANELLKNTLIDGIPLEKLWNKIKIDYIL